MMNGEINGLNDFKLLVSDSQTIVPDGLSSQGGELNGSKSESGPDELLVPASRVRVELGLGACPVCGGGKLVEVKDGDNSWHVCEHSQVKAAARATFPDGYSQRGTQSKPTCDFKVYCFGGRRPCSLGQVVVAPVLEPCKFGHVGSWVLRERRGRSYWLVCHGPNRGHGIYCGESFMYWPHAKPTFQRRPTDNPDGYTVHACLQALRELDRPLAVSEVADDSGISERKVRACLKRMSRAATPLVKELGQRGYAPWCRRYVLQYCLTDEGEITIDYELQHGIFADGARSVVRVEAEQPPPERPVLPAQSVGNGHADASYIRRGIEALPIRPPLR